MAKRIIWIEKQNGCYELSTMSGKPVITGSFDSYSKILTWMKENEEVLFHEVPSVDQLAFNDLEKSL